MDSLFMQRWLLILLQLGILVLVLRMPMVQGWLKAGYYQASEAVSSISRWSETRMLDDLKDDLMGWSSTLRPYQQEYLDGVLKDRDSINRFHQTFCMSADKNPYLKGASLAFLCMQLEKTELLNTH